MQDQNQTESLPFRLRDGTTIVLRPVVHADRERIQGGMTMLSSQSRYFRFFTSVQQLPRGLLEHLTEIDQQNHVAWLALDPSPPSPLGLGIARFVRLPDDPSTAEMAFVVIDSWQRRGVGTALLALLHVKAAALGIRVLRAVVLPENTATIVWLKGLGATPVYDENQFCLDLTVGPAEPAVPQTDAAENFHSAIQIVQAALTRNDEGGR